MAYGTSNVASVQPSGTKAVKVRYNDGMEIIYANSEWQSMGGSLPGGSSGSSSPSSTSSGTSAGSSSSSGSGTDYYKNLGNVVETKPSGSSGTLVKYANGRLIIYTNDEWAQMQGQPAPTSTPTTTPTQTTDDGGYDYTTPDGQTVHVPGWAVGGPYDPQAQQGVLSAAGSLSLDTAGGGGGGGAVTTNGMQPVVTGSPQASPTGTVPQGLPTGGGLTPTSAPIQGVLGTDTGAGMQQPQQPQTIPSPSTSAKSGMFPIASPGGVAGNPATVTADGATFNMNTGMYRQVDKTGQTHIFREDGTRVTPSEFQGTGVETNTIPIRPGLAPTFQEMGINPATGEPYDEVLASMGSEGADALGLDSYSTAALRTLANELTSQGDVYGGTLLRSYLDTNSRLDQINSQFLENQTKLANEQAALNLGMNKIEGEVAPLPLLVGRQAELQRQGTARIGALQNEQAIIEQRKALAGESFDRMIKLGEALGYTGKETSMEDDVLQKWMEKYPDAGITFSDSLTSARSKILGSGLYAKDIESDSDLWDMDFGGFNVGEATGETLQRLMEKYPDAGITFDDDLTSARQKVLDSPLYQNDVRVDEDEDLWDMGDTMGGWGGFGAANDVWGQFAIDQKGPVMPGNIPQRDNNPMAITLGGATRKWVDAGLATAGSANRDGTFLKFANAAIGMAAGVDLLGSNIYSGLSIDQALNKWSNGGYGAEIAPALDGNRKIASLNTGEKQYLAASIADNEGWYAGRARQKPIAYLTGEGAVDTGERNPIMSLLAPTAQAAGPQVAQAPTVNPYQAGPNMQGTPETALTFYDAQSLLHPMMQDYFRTTPNGTWYFDISDAKDEDGPRIRAMVARMGLRNPNTGKRVPVLKIDTQDAQRLLAIQKISDMADDLLEMHANPNVVGTGETHPKNILGIPRYGSATRLAGFKRMLQGGGALGAIFGGSPELRTFQAQRKARLSSIARTFGGEKGTLTDKDIARVEESLPNIWDNNEDARYKVSALKESLAQEQADLYKQMGLPVPDNVNVGAGSVNLDDILQQLGL